MCTSVVFRLAIGLPRSADTELGALINKPKQNLKNKRQRPQKTFLPCFPNGKKHIKILTVIGAGGGVFATQWSWKLPALLNGGGSNDNGFTNVILLFNTDHCEAIKWHSNTVSLIMPHYDAEMGDEGMGSRWTSKSPHGYHCQNATRSKTYVKFKNKNICRNSITIWSIFIPGHYLNTDHHVSLLL